MIELLLTLNGVLIGLFLCTGVYLKYILSNIKKQEIGFCSLIEEQQSGVKKLADLQRSAIESHRKLQEDMATMKTEIAGLKNKNGLAQVVRGTGR